MNKSPCNVSVIIPVYNEEEMIDQTLINLDFPFVKEIIVINDGSTDNTLQMIKKHPVFLINLSKNRGKGNAVLQGLTAASGKFILLIDGDLGESVKEIDCLVEAVRDKKNQIAIADMTITGGGLGLVRKLADRGLFFVTGKSLKAPLSGQRCFPRELIKDIIPLSADYGLETGINIDLLNSGYQINEIKCNLTHRQTGKDFTGYLHRSRQFYQILKTLFLKFIVKLVKRGSFYNQGGN